MEGIGGFTQNAVFTRFCILCIFDLFVRFLMNEPDGYESPVIIVATLISLHANFSTDEYVFTQNTIAFDFASTYPS